MRILDWLKRRRALGDAEAIERAEEQEREREALPEGRRFLADEDRLGRAEDELILDRLPPEDE